MIRNFKKVLLEGFIFSKGKNRSFHSNLRRAVFFVSLRILFGVLWAAPYHTVVIDGSLGDWSSDEIIVADGVDSVWDPSQGINEIKNVYATWDASNLYLAIEGSAKDKGVILYIDTGRGRGYTDLREIKTWNRRVAFAGGFAPDFFFAAWGSSDGNFYKLTSSWTAEDVSSRCVLKGPASSGVSKRGWEIKIPFDLIYSLGNSVPPRVTLKVFVSLATGDVASSAFGSYGYLGGDCAPDDNITGLGDATISKSALISPDADDGDGIPDDKFKGVALAFRSITVTPVRFAPTLEGGSFVSVVAETSREASVTADVYDIAGRLIKSLPQKNISSNGFSRTFLWDGFYDSSAGGGAAPRGVYIISIRATNGSESVRVNKAIALIR